MILDKLHSQSERSGDRKNLLPFPGMEPQFLGRLAHSLVTSLYKIRHPDCLLQQFMTSQIVTLRHETANRRQTNVGLNIPSQILSTRQQQENYDCQKNFTCFNPSRGIIVKAKVKSDKIILH
jgi:hypothetical protein